MDDHPAGERGAKFKPSSSSFALSWWYVCKTNFTYDNMYMKTHYHNEAIHYRQPAKPSHPAS